jgi:predicted MPP superfamily phosphohydrolase
MKSRKAWALITACAAVVALLSYSFIVEPNFVVTTASLVLGFENLPREFHGFRIAHVSDLHFGTWHLAIRDDLVIRTIEGFEPNLIVITGDLICSPSSVEEALRFTARLVSIAPTIVVVGNWDYWSGANVTLFVERLRGIGAVVLINEHIDVERGGSKIYVAGLDDPYTMRDDLERALSGTPLNSFKIILAHSPEAFKKARGRVNLVLAGHTHGGQVVVPLLGPLYVPLPPGSREYVKGLFVENGTSMYVTSGVGCSLLPMRFLCPPEVASITLVKK